jgi:hypothetical protein
VVAIAEVSVFSFGRMNLLASGVAAHTLFGRVKARFDLAQTAQGLPLLGCLRTPHAAHVVAATRSL